MHKFVNTHLHTSYSVKDGLFFPMDYLKILREHSSTACSITDHGTMAGVFDFFDSASKVEIKPIIGGEFYHVDDKTTKDKPTHIILLAKNLLGYKALLKSQYDSAKNGFYYRSRIDWRNLETMAGNIICQSACSGGIIAKNLDNPKLDEIIGRLKDIFKEDFYFEYVALERTKYYGPIWQRMHEIAVKQGIKEIISCDVHYIKKSDWKIQEILHNVERKTTMADMKQKESTGQGKGWMMEDKDLYLKNYDEIMNIMKNVFTESQVGEFLDNTNLINSKIEKYNIYPEKYVYPKIQINEEEMKTKIKENLYKKCEINDANVNVYKERIKEEWNLIKSGGFLEYFYIVADIIGFCKKNNIMTGTSRGSVGGCLIAYLLDIIEMDAIEHNLSFSRFYSSERIKQPDIDNDIQKSQRQQVLNYIKKYGDENVIQIGAYNTYTEKNAFKDVARIYGVAASESDSITTTLMKKDETITVDEIANFLCPKPQTPDEIKYVVMVKEKYAKIIEMAKHMKGLIRHFSRHAAGVLILDKPVYEYIPTIRAGDDILSAIDGDTLSAKKFLKIDILGLEALDIISDTLYLIKKYENKDISIRDLNLEDEKVLKMFKELDVDNIFQFDTPLMKGYTRSWDGKRQKGLLERILPDRFEHLVHLNALNRPGPLKIHMDEDYEKRRLGSKYITPKLLEKHLKDTYGLLIYQEQIINIFADWLDINLGKADIMRKKMEKSTIKDLLNEGNYYHHLFEKYDKTEIEDALKMIEKSGGYVFNKSHVQGYTILAFQMAFLKCYYRKFFNVSVLNTEDTDPKKGMPKIKKTLQDCYDRGWVKPYNFNEISYRFDVDKNGYIIPGVRILKGVGEKSVADIIKNKPYRNMADFLTRAKCNKNILEVLDNAGFFINSFGKKLDLSILPKEKSKKVILQNMFG